VRFYPQPVIASIIDRAASRLRLALPCYLGIRIALEHEPMWGTHSNLAVSAASRLAVAQAGLDISKTPPTNDVAPGSVAGQPRLEFEAFLADPPQLYARARQRAWLLGSFVGLASLLALLGLAFAHRLFQRQLRLNELKSNFVSSVSQELRAPIASVRLLAEGLDRGTVSEEPRRREYFRLIVQECRRLSALIENALDFSRIERGRKRYDFEPTDVARLVDQTVQLMLPRASELGVRLEFARHDNANDVPPCLDGRAIQQALVNLLENALKHSPPSEAVTVELICPHSANPPGANRAALQPHPPIVLSVTDHGPGIPVEAHERIFEPFFRRGSELKRETPGIGIGLSIVKHIVEAHGGRIRVENAKPIGSRFVMELPAGTRPNPASPETKLI
jgi:signal transduction histidine kinase